MSEAKKQADLLRKEAVKHLTSLLGIPEGYTNGKEERLIDCIIGAAMLEIAALQAEALQASKQKEQAT